MINPCAGVNTELEGTTDSLPSTSKFAVRRRDAFLRQRRRRNTPSAATTPRKTRVPAIAATRVIPEILLDLDEADAFDDEAGGGDVGVEGVDCWVTDGEFAFKHELLPVEPETKMPETPPVRFCASLIANTTEVPAGMLAALHTYSVAPLGAFNTIAVPPGTSPWNNEN